MHVYGIDSAQHGHNDRCDMTWAEPLENASLEDEVKFREAVILSKTEIFHCKLLVELNPSRATIIIFSPYNLTYLIALWS
jgi:hypothetical protein